MLRKFHSPWILVFIPIILSVPLKSQVANFGAINTYIDFNNECVHGMLIVHRLLENFNQEVNTFVDLESHQVNFYSNVDLPQDIFEDPDHWFYDKTPYEWFKILASLDMEKEWKTKLDKVAFSMRKTISAINRIRFEASSYIKENDLADQSSQEGIYEILERGVFLFENFYQHNRLLHRLISEYIKHYEVPRSSFAAVHSTMVMMLDQLRNKQDEHWKIGVEKLEMQLKTTTLAGEQRSKSYDFLRGAKQFINSGEVISEYKLYGKYYYYHNSLLLNYANRYGNGYVSAYNQKIDRDRELKLLEIPHFYEVIYPNRWMEDIPLASKDPIILALPDRLRDRKITTSERVLLVDDEIVEIELYDHRIIDGDIVSVNFNGDWILEEYALKGKPYPLKIRLNREGRNYILLHAVNLGKKPPNTMAMRYRYKDQEHTVILSSDLDESEIIELKLDN